MPARIEFQDAEGRARTVLLRDEPVYVGRALNCAIRTDASAVSPIHAVIRREDGKYWIEDLESDSGIEIHGVKTPRHMLAHNETVRCGSLLLRYVEFAHGPVPIHPPRPGSPDEDPTTPLFLPGIARGGREPPDSLIAENRALREYIEELRQELERAKEEQARMAAEIERLRRTLGE